MVAFAFPGPYAQYRPATGQQIQGRGGLRGDRWIAATSIGHTNTKPQPPQPVPGGKVSEHRPRFQVGVDLRYQFR